MKKSILKLDATGTTCWQTVMKNNHGRQVYIKISIIDNQFVEIVEVFYIDRPWKFDLKSVPLKLTTKSCKIEDLLRMLTNELDKKFYGVEFVNDGSVLSTEEYIESFLDTKRKYKFLILIESGDVLKTRLKNRTRRVIYLEIKRNVNKAVVSACHYTDRLYKRDKTLITPSGLTTIYFDYSLDEVLKIVNTELNCNFSDVIVTPDTFGFDKTELPICGSI